MSEERDHAITHPRGRPWVVVCAGLLRSGSAWLYNTARLAMAARGPVYACPEHLYDPADPRPQHLIKAHGFRADLCERADRILITRRDLRDIAASAIRVGLVAGELGVVNLSDQIVAAHRMWRPHSAAEIVFERMIADKPGATAQVLDALFDDPEFVNLDCAAISEAVEALEPPERERGCYDPLTLMVPGHVTDGRAGSYDQTLPRKWIEVIEQLHGGWLSEYGYRGD
jgi:hypothetical protein